MSCQEFRKTFARKQAKYCEVYIGAEDSSSLDITVGSFVAYAVLDKADLETAYDEDSTNYLFTKTDVEIKAVSDLSTNWVTIPLSKTDFDIESDFYLVLVYDLGEYARGKIIVKYVNCLNGNN